MTARIDAPIESLPHMCDKRLWGDIWFYRDECRYLKEAWVETPVGFEPESLIDNDNDEIFLRAEGKFSIPESFYLAPADDPTEYAAFRHFNAVDANICFNQLAYVLCLEGCPHGLIPLWKFGVDPESMKCRKVAVNMMIAKMNTTFVRPIQPMDFKGWIAINKLYEKKGMPFMEMEFQFEGEGAGLAVGECRAVIFVQNFCENPGHPHDCEKHEN